MPRSSRGSQLATAHPNQILGRHLSTALNFFDSENSSLAGQVPRSLFLTLRIFLSLVLGVQQCPILPSNPLQLVGSRVALLVFLVEFVFLFLLRHLDLLLQFEGIKVQSAFHSAVHAQRE